MSSDLDLPGFIGHFWAQIHLRTGGIWLNTASQETWQVWGRSIEDKQGGYPDASGQTGPGERFYEQVKHLDLHDRPSTRGWIEHFVSSAAGALHGVTWDHYRKLAQEPDASQRGEGQVLRQDTARIGSTAPSAVAATSTMKPRWHKRWKCWRRYWPIPSPGASTSVRYPRHLLPPQAPAGGTGGLRDRDPGAIPPQPDPGVSDKVPPPADMGRVRFVTEIVEQFNLRIAS